MAGLKRVMDNIKIDNKILQFRELVKIDPVDRKRTINHFTKSQLVSMLERAISTADDLASYIKSMQNKVVLNCVYCGHQYPDGTPASKAKELEDHIAQCEKHPMATLTAKVRAFVREGEALIDRHIKRCSKRAGVGNDDCAACEDLAMLSVRLRKLVDKDKEAFVAVMLEEDEAKAVVKEFADELKRIKGLSDTEWPPAAVTLAIKIKNALKRVSDAGTIGELKATRRDVERVLGLEDRDDEE